MRIGSRGNEVEAAQWALMAKGYELPRWGADGRLGLESWQALADFAADHGLSWSAAAVESAEGNVPARVLEALLAPEEESTPPPAPAAPDFVNLVPERTEPPPKTKRDAQGRVIARPAARIDGITIHQTACVFGVTARQIKAAGGDAQRALHRRFLNVACHVAALRSGTVLKTNEFETYVYHGNGLNAATLGLEIEGIYPGSQKKPRSPVPDKAITPLTPAVIDAARRALAFMVDEARMLGMPVQFIYAHRQSSATRRPDPGEQIWREVVLEYVIPELGLVTKPKFTVGTGKPIPTLWDPSGVGPY